jgi:hypothetical protein
VSGKGEKFFPRFISSFAFYLESFGIARLRRHHHQHQHIVASLRELCSIIWQNEEGGGGGGKKEREIAGFVRAAIWETIFELSLFFACISVQAPRALPPL